MKELSKFSPNWASAPGETISDILEEKNISYSDFSKLMEISLTFADQLIKGTAVITQEMSVKLARTLGATSEFWLNREEQYREDVSRLSNDRVLNWMRSLPLKDMVKFGWLPEKPKDFRACLDYFGVPDITSWHQKYEVELAMASFRTSARFKSSPAAVSTWLRQGEIQSENIVCKDWDPARFKEALKVIKKLTKVKEPELFIPKLVELCASCGVAVTIVPTPIGCSASGVTKFIHPKRALLMLSFRYLTDDQFWFTFFHEAGHLLLHSSKSTFVEGIAGNDISFEETEANQFAAEQLIPKELRDELMKVSVSNPKSVVRFAAMAGVSAGIVVGQLQHLGIVDKGRFNSYKRRYTWQ